MIIYSREEGNARKPSHRDTFSGLEQTVSAICDPVTVPEVRSALRLGDTSQDALLAAYISAATYTAETYVGRDFIPSTYVQYLDEWPQGDIEVLRPPLQSVTSIKYLDDAGDQQTLATDQYDVDNKRFPALISRAYGVSWPTLRGQNGQIEITLVAGMQEKTGELAGSLAAGAQTSILADAFDGTPERTGIIHLINAVGESEVVYYSGYRVLAGEYEFTVNYTTQYSYEDDAVVTVFNTPEIWRQGIIALVVDMFEHPEASSEVILHENMSIQRLLKMNAIQEF